MTTTSPKIIDAAHRFGTTSRAVVPYKTSQLTYVRHAALHPGHAFVLVVPAAVLIIGWSLAFLLAAMAAAELFLLTIVPKVSAFRRHVDLKIEQTRRAIAAEERSALLARMMREHRAELERLEALSDRVRERVATESQEMSVVVDDTLGLGRLLADYVRLAIAYRSATECLAMTNRQALREEIRVLSQARHGENEQSRALALRRLAVAEMRAERWDRTAGDVDAMRQQLALIAEVVQLMHEQSLAPVDPRVMSLEIDRAVSQIHETERTMRELSELLTQQQAVDPEVLELGRASAPVLHLFGDGRVITVARDDVGT
jgi:hypothetical protein